MLEDISLHASRGEFVSFIGPSGCGKTTLLKLIAGLARVSEGQLSIAGGEPTDFRRHMAFIFQEPTLLPWLSVAKNIQLPLRLRGVPENERHEIAGRLIRLVRLDDVKDFYPRELSGGMKMRVSVARALALSPKILLLDEPFGALDEMTRNHLNEELLAIRSAEEWTAFFVTHSVSEAVFLSSN